MKRKLAIIIILVSVISIFLISACSQQQVIQEQPEQKVEEKEEKIEPIDVKIISAPKKWLPDENLTITWQVTGSKGNISHTAIHYDTISHDADFKLYSKASTYQTGTVPQLFRASIKATKEKFMYIRAHSIVDGNHYYDEEKSIVIELPAPTTAITIEQPKQETVQEKTPQVTELPLVIKEFTVKADDNKFDPSSIEVAKGEKVKLILKVSDTNVYFGGLLFTADEVNYDSGDIKPGDSTIYEFTADKPFTISSWWPSPKRFKADFKVNLVSNPGLSITSGAITQQTPEPQQTQQQSTSIQQKKSESIVDTIYESDSKIYTLLDKSFEVKADFIGSDFAKFSINGELSPKLEIGSLVTLNDALKITLLETITSNIDASWRARFNLTREATS